MPTITKVYRLFKLKLILYFLKKKNDNKKMEAIINLNEATVIGLKLSKLILIAINADPQIALSINSKLKLFEYNLENR